ncbi:MAG: hypothetical protein KIT19_08865 [Phycisphaeraceae bacterium]|nr:hypothetical protein [Phycisphaeraceae bacterium]QYK48271.1 MAG: hypothetical protein KF838_00115 [Phycisphaeraceae bacterium]
MAAPTTWVYTNPNDRPVISDDSVYIRLWEPTPVLVPNVNQATLPFEAIRMGTYGDDIFGATIVGNNAVGVFPPPSPSLYVPGGLRLEGTTLESHGSDFWQYWYVPVFNPNTGSTQAADIYQGGSDGDFDLTSFSYGMEEYAYIGFANYQLTRFGYLQIERSDAIDPHHWRLVGYAYGEVGETIEVVDLTVVPPAPSAAVLVLFMAGMPRSRPES